MKITIKEINTQTGEEIIYEREETPEEINSREKAQLEREQKESEAEAKAQAKATAQAKLGALGLTTDDLRALGL